MHQLYFLLLLFLFLFTSTHSQVVPNDNLGLWNKIYEFLLLQKNGFDKDNAFHLLYQARSFTVREKLDTVMAVAKNYASDVKLRGIHTFEGVEIQDDTLDGKVYSATYVLYSPSKEKYISVHVNALTGIILDTVYVPFTSNVDLPNVFVDSDVAFSIAEANGGASFRSEPNTITRILYDLRSYEQFDFPAPDTVNPYWRIVYSKSDSNYTPISFLVIYLNPSDGKLVLKYMFEPKPVTAKAKFAEIDAFAKKHASDAQLMYVFGVEDSLVDGKCYLWNYGYRTISGYKFSVSYSMGIIFLDTLFLPIELTMPLSLFGNYKDSDILSQVSERNGGSQFRSTHKLLNQLYLYSQSPLNPFAIYFHGVYVGADTVDDKMRILFVFVDPLTGRFVGSFTQVERDDGYGVPREFALYQNYPNPFNPTTTITYDIPIRSDVRLVVYNVLGQEVAVLVDEIQDAGRYSVRFDASGLPSGVYFYRLKAGKYVETKKMMIVK